MSALGLPALGHGVGLRIPHYREILDGLPSFRPEGAASPRARGDTPRAVDVDWLEVISENFLVDGGNPRRVLRAVRSRWPIVLHGVSLSLGSVDPLDERYLDRLDTLAREIEPAWISDHLCFSSLGGHTGHDLWPLPYTEEALAHVARRVERVQERLGRRILVENVSSYLAYAHSTMSEWEFLAALAERADCGLLLDVNNVFVSARNHGFDARAFVDGLPIERIGQIHLAGHQDHGTHLLDTHDHPVRDEVWALYRRVVERCAPGRVATLVEWDDAIPPLDEVLAESRRARGIEAEVLGAREHVGAARG